jgi:uncharacterized protein
MKVTTKSQTAKGTLIVTGEGQIKLRPDMAIVDLAVVTTARTAQEASAQNAERMTSVLGALKVLGLPSADIQTVGYNVSPIIDNEEKSPTFGKIVQYRVTSDIRVRADVERAGEVIDCGIEAGANMSGGLRFGMRDETSARTRALKAAVKAARRDADTVADALAVKIRSAESAELMTTGAPMIFREAMFAKSATPIEPGTIDISASVRVTYRYS